MEKQFRIALTFGRFNLLHKGHLDLFRWMAAAADDVNIGVSTGSKNLPFKLRSDIILKAIKEDPTFNAAQFQVNPKHSPFGMFEKGVTWFYPPEQTVLYLGNDQYELGEKISEEFGVTCETIPRLTSSTTVRSLIDNEEWAMLSKEVPSSIIHQIILLRKQELCPNSH